MAKQKIHEKPGRPAGSYRYAIIDFQSAWERYKDGCDTAAVHEVSAGKVVRVPRPRIYTLSAFQVYMGMTRETWSEYRLRDGYAEVIQMIEQEVLACKESALLNAKGSAAGLIFDLKCNYGWVDKQVVDAKVDVTSVEVKLIPAAAMAIATSEKEVEDNL